MDALGDGVGCGGALMTLPHVNDIAPADQTSWYRAYWLKVGLGLGAGFLVLLALLLYAVVTHPIVSALERLR